GPRRFALRPLSEVYERSAAPRKTCLVLPIIWNAVGPHDLALCDEPAPISFYQMIELATLKQQLGRLTLVLGSYLGKHETCCSGFDIDINEQIVDQNI